MEPVELDEHPNRVDKIAGEEYVAVDKNLTVGRAVEEFRRQSPEDDEATVYYAYVVEDEALVGVLSMRDLLQSEDDESVGSIMNDDVISLDADQDPETAARTIQEHDLMALPIVDDEDRIVGIARVDALMDIVDEEASEDIYRQAGLAFTGEEVSRSTAILQSPLRMILWLRMPWLLVALAGGLAAGAVIDQFEETLEAVIILAFFVPAIMDMGGNVGTQSSTIFVRGLALGHIDEKTARSHILKEGLVGATIGVLIGAVAGTAGFVWANFFWAGTETVAGPAVATEVGIVIFVSMVVTCFVASLVGYVVPYISHVLDLDPAAVSDPFITTIKDITALVVYFGLATLLLSEVLAVA